MKKLSVFLAALLFTLTAGADTKISALPAATTLTGTEAVPMVQGGATVRSTAANIAAAGQTLVDLSSTVAVTGMSSTSILVVSAVKTGHLVVLFIQIQGTSNATTFSMTGIPATYWPTVGTRGVLIRGDNSLQNYGSFNMATSGTLDFFSDPSSGAWTASGVKSIQRSVLTWIN